MAIVVDAGSRVLVQGITGREGTFHTQRMLAAGTKVVAGTTPGKGGQSVEGVPVFDTVAAAVAATGADTSVVFVPARFARDALLEAADAGVATVVCITEGIAVRDMTEAAAHLARRGVTLIGPNCPGIITPGACSAGIMPAQVFLPGAVGLVSRSGTLTYEIVDSLTRAGLGQSTCIGMGGDPVHGVGFVECLELFARDEQTAAVVLVGEIGGDDEERAAAFVRDVVRQAGRRVPRGLLGAARQAHGPRRGDHLGRLGHGERQEAGPGTGRRAGRGEPGRGRRTGARGARPGVR